MLTSGRFYYGAEVVTTRGLPRAERRRLAPWPGPAGRSADRLDFVTDNPGGGPMLPPDWLAGQVAERAARWWSI